MIEIITAVSDREEIAFATMLARKHGMEGPAYFLNYLLNDAIRQVMEQENWSSDQTDVYCPRSDADDLDDGIPF